MDRKSQNRVTSDRFPTLVLAAILGLSVVVKFIVVLQLRSHPLTQPDTGLDTTAYADLAAKVLNGDLGLGPGLYYVSPFYIYFLASALGLTHSYTAVRLLQILIGTASIGLMFATAREWFGDRAAWMAATLALLTGLFTFYEALILQAALDPVLTSAALFALTLALRRDRTSWMIAAGLIFGLATLNRPNMALGAGGVAMLLLATRRVRPAIVLVAGLVAGMAPAAIRNVVVAHQWSFASSQGGLNFYIGNNETATGFFHQVPGISPSIAGQERDARHVAERAVGHTLSEAETSDYFFGLAWTWIRQNPGSALGLFLYKLRFVFSAQHIALPYSYPFYAYDAHTALRFLVVGPWIVVPLGLVGLLFAAPVARRTEYLVWASFVPCYGASVAMFFVSERYRLPVLVPLVIGAGAAIDVVVTALSSRRASSLATPAVCLVGLFVFANWPNSLHDGRWDEGQRLVQRLIILKRYDEADEWVKKLEPNEPRRGLIQESAGIQLLVENQEARAVPYLVKAQAASPGQPTVEYALGQALLAVGRAQDALPHLQLGYDKGVAIHLAGYDLAVALQTLGDLPAAAKVLRTIAPIDDDGADVWLRLGRLAAEVHAPDVAEPFFRRAVQLAPADAAARHQFGLDLMLLRRYPEAAVEMSEAVRLDPKDPESLWRLAYCEYQLGRLNEARVHVEASLAINPNDEFAKQLAEALRRLK